MIIIIIICYHKSHQVSPILDGPDKITQIAIVRDDDNDGVKKASVQWARACVCTLHTILIKCSENLVKEVIVFCI